MIPSLKQFTILCILSFVSSSGCAGQARVTKPPTAAGQTVTPAETSEPQGPVTEAPLMSEPAGPVVTVNPLTGLPVQDPSLLDVPAALVSIAHFPVEARPQLGLSYAPWIFEVYITEVVEGFIKRNASGMTFSQLFEVDGRFGASAKLLTLPFRTSHRWKTRPSKYHRGDHRCSHRPQRSAPCTGDRVRIGVTLEAVRQFS